MEASVGFSLYELFKMGGGFMWPLLAFSIATISIIVERIIYFNYHDLKIIALKDNIRTYIRENNFDGAMEYLKTKTSKSFGARILQKMLKNYSLPSERLEKVAEQEAAECMQSLENGLDFLVALGSISPLTGFLGTVSGMIGAFKSIAEASDVNMQIVAGGIYEALITTVFGLIIAIVAMVGHSLFIHRSDKFAGEVEKSCSILVTDRYLKEGESGNRNHFIELK
ncbi:MAG: hypothetical protein Ta2G_03860 [Termitinemataceae bacterium]|nr:MAG: hypothetical protein Ta2G_03860 [Termitinemataceae bacterium]